MTLGELPLVKTNRTQSDDMHGCDEETNWNWNWNWSSHVTKTSLSETGLRPYWTHLMWLIPLYEWMFNTSPWHHMFRHWITQLHHSYNTVIPQLYHSPHSPVHAFHTDAGVKRHQTLNAVVQTSTGAAVSTVLQLPTTSQWDTLLLCTWFYWIVTNRKFNGGFKV